MGNSFSESTLDGNASISNDLNDDTIVEGALFDETAAAYARLRTKTENVMADLLGQAMRDALKAYVRGYVKFVNLIHHSQLSDTSSIADGGVNLVQRLSFSLLHIVQRLNPDLNLTCQARQPY